MSQSSGTIELADIEALALNLGFIPFYNGALVDLVLSTSEVSESPYFSCIYCTITQHCVPLMDISSFNTSGSILASCSPLYETGWKSMRKQLQPLFPRYLQPSAPFARWVWPEQERIALRLLWAHGSWAVVIYDSNILKELVPRSFDPMLSEVHRLHLQEKIRKATQQSCSFQLQIYLHLKF